MSYYYKYTFTSPESIYSLVKEEFKSYFDTGAVDDLLFPTYLDKCLKRLGRSSYIIFEDVIEIDNFQGRLPDNFYAVREAWMLTNINSITHKEAGSFYSQTTDSNIIQVSPITTNQVCNNESCTDQVLNNDICTDLEYDVECESLNETIVYKVNNSTNYTFRKEYLLKPGNISVSRQCDVNYMDNWNEYSIINTPGSSTIDSFDIRDNKFVTNFRNGFVQIIFYSTEQDECGNQLVPDNYRIKEYVEAFIKYKVIEQLTNQVNDETINQLERKLDRYKMMADEAYIMAELEIKKQDVYSKQRAIVRNLNRFNMYNLPTRSRRSNFKR